MKEVVPVLETYYVKPQTVDRVRASWIGVEIERYVRWLAEHGYAARSVLRRVPLLVAFGEFAHVRGARTVGDLAPHVEPFVAERVAARRGSAPERQVAKEIRGPIEQMLRLIVPDFAGRGRPHSPEPFADAVPGFFEHLTCERGLRPASIRQYRHHLARFEAYLTRIGVAGLDELSPAILSAFVAERAGVGLAKSTIRNGCGVLSVFLRYVHRSGLVRSELSGVIESGQVYRLSSIPRSISRDQVGQVLAGVDRRSPVGKRDYAILLLLVTYGLRAREIAAMTLDDIDWKRERLAVPERKAGHSTAFPLTAERGVRRLEELTPALLDEFLASRPRLRPRSFNHLLGVVRGLLDWAVNQEMLEASPLHTRPRRAIAGQIPFIFDLAQARRLLEAAAALPDNARAPQRGTTYRAIFALCYGLGLRAGEACGLRLGDVDTRRGLLSVHGGKFGKSRLVPHGPRIGELLVEQVERRRRRAALDETSPLFTFDGRRNVHPGSASQTFHHLVGELELTVPAGVSPPRLHSLRHSFAVGCLTRWYRQGLDPATRLHHLSTFMGHVDPTSTAVYLTITPLLMQEANRRFEAFAESAWAEVAR